MMLNRENAAEHADSLKFLQPAKEIRFASLPAPRGTDSVSPKWFPIFMAVWITLFVVYLGATLFVSGSPSPF